MRSDELVIQVPGVSYHFYRIGLDQYALQLTGNSGYAYDFGAILIDRQKV